MLLALIAGAVAGAPEAEAHVRTGSYSGNGAPRSVTGLGFQPDVVILKGNDDTIQAVVRTSSMGLSKEMVGSVAAVGGLITSLDADGFSVSGDTRVNQTGIAYYWIAFRMVAGESKIGSYSGNGGPSQDILGLGFSPASVVVIPTSADPVYHRSSPMPAGESFDFDNSTGDTNRILAMLPDGFRVGNDADVNGAGLAYDYVAWKALPGKMAVGSYVGDGLDNRSIAGIGLRPEYVVVKRDGSDGASHKPLSTGAAIDASLLFSLSSIEVDAIQALEADGFRVGTLDRVNRAGETYYWMAFADCPPLTASENASTVTVAAPGSFEVRWSTATGGGIDQLYDLAEDPSRSTDLVGGTSLTQALYNHSLEVGGAPWETARNSVGSKLDLLEATRTRVRVRQEAFFQQPSSAILPGVKGLGDYSVYPSGRLALDWRRQATSGVAYTLDDLDVTVHAQTSGPLSGWTAYGESNGVGFPGPGTDAFLLFESDSAGARTDFLTILSRGWLAANGYVASADRTNQFDSPPDQLRMAFWQDTTATAIPAGASEAWQFLTYFKPTDFINHSDVRTTSRRDDYRNPAAVTIGVGGPWIDAAENTAGGDAFNEKEAAYVFTLDPALGLTFDIDGSTTTRYAPFFKVRQWPALGPPRQVLLEGTPLIKDADYHADVKPVARAQLVPALSWHCTLESTTACTVGTLDVGSGGAVSGGTIVAARYGNGLSVGGATDFVSSPFSDFSFINGGIELWYRPNYDSTSLTPHLLWYNTGGFVGNYNCVWLEHAGGNLVLGAYRGGTDQTCTSGGTSLFTLTIPGTQFAWRAGDWVHLRTTLDASVAARVYVDGRLVGSTGAYNTVGFTVGATRIGSCALGSCPGGGAARHADGVIDEPHIYESQYGSTGLLAFPIAHAGLLTDPYEQLADPGRNYLLSFMPVDSSFRGNYLYIGADAKFRGLNVDLATPGAGVAVGALVWQYWDGTRWASLEGVPGFTDTTNSLQRDGRLYWSGDPFMWSPYSVDGGPDLFYVRVHLGGAATYTTVPVERLIKTDILLFQLCGDVTTAAQTFSFSPLGTADLAITKTDGQTTGVPGTTISYTITVTNTGPDTVTSVFVSDAVPAGITGAAFAPSSGTYDSVTGEWTGLSLAATQSAVLVMSGTIHPFARGTLTNTATVSPPAGTDDPNGANDVASDTDTLDPSADVKVVKTDDPDPAPLGGLLAYTLTVTNDGPSGATNVTVTDTLPLDMDLDTAPGAIVPSQGTCSYVAGTRTVSCSLGDLGPALVATVTIKVRPGAARLFDNAASVTHGDPDPDAGNDAESETTLVEVSSLGVRFFTATSTNERNVLEWVNPTDADYASTEIVVKAGSFPTGPGDGFTLYNGNDGGSGGRWKITHNTGVLSNDMTFYYGAFVHRASAPLISPGRFVTGRPFNHAPGPVKWAFSTGATALAAPTVGGAGVIATSNDKVVYAMERGTDDDQLGVDSGEWPASFRPIELGGPVQHRSPVIPVTVGSSNPVVYLGAQDGKLYVVDATQGGSLGFPWGPTAIGPMVQAAPGGIFGPFGSSLDYLLVGTRNATTPNAFVALNPYTGAEVDRFDNGGAGPGEIGIVNGSAAVDYGPPLPPRAYFTNYERTPVGSTLTLRCFELQSTAPVFNQLWARALGNIDSSPVLRGGRVYVGSPLGGGTVYSIDALDGGNSALDRTFVHNNGQVRGFVFPDRATNDIYFATDDFVWGVTDTGAAIMTNKFTGPVSLPGGAKPSPVLFVPGSHYVYVGGSDGNLYEIDTLQATPVPKPVMLGNGLAVVGAPSLDRVNNLVHVGTEAGIFYAVQIPLP